MSDELELSGLARAAKPRDLTVFNCDAGILSVSLGPRPVSKHGSPERRNRTWNHLHMKALFRLQRCMKVRKWGKMNGEHAYGFASKVLDSFLIGHVPCIS